MTIIGYVEVHGTIQFDNNQRGIRKKHKELKPDLKLLYIEVNRGNRYQIKLVFPLYSYTGDTPRGCFSF